MIDFEEVEVERELKICCINDLVSIRKKKHSKILMISISSYNKLTKLFQYENPTAI